MSEAGLEPARPFRSTAISTLRVCLFHHPDVNPAGGSLTAGAEPRPRFERGTSALRVRRIYRLSYRGMKLRCQDSNLDYLVQSQAGCQITPYRIGGRGGIRTLMSFRTPGLESGASSQFHHPPVVRQMTQDPCVARDSCFPRAPAG